MAIQLSLAWLARRRLVRLDRNPRDADLRIRCRIVLRVDEGTSSRAAARAPGCAPSMAARIVARFRHHRTAVLRDGRSGNDHRKVDADANSWTTAALEHCPTVCAFPRPIWTLELIVEQVRLERA